jgi:GABA(A) receptor-associated protein
MRFKQEFSFEQRREESTRVLNRYPDRVPIICEKSSAASKDCPEIDKKKYLVPRNLNMGHFLYIIRKRLQLAPEKAIFLFVGNSIAPSTLTINQIYAYNKEQDGFLYINYSFENVFG